MARVTLFTVRDRVRAEDWRGATRQAAEALVGIGAATDEYPSACVDVVEQHGPYIVLAPGLALVHARPETGGLQVGVAVTRLAEPTPFGHAKNDPVDLLLAFCTPDDSAHVELLGRLARALGGGLAERLRTANDEADLRRIFEEVRVDA